jgi:hypothetical protein
MNALRITACGLLLALTACTGLPPHSRDIDSASPHIAAGTENDVDALLRYHQRIKKMGPAELNKEYEQINQAYTQKKTEFGRVQLSLLLSSPNAPFRDDAMALTLLKDWLKDVKPPYSGLRAFGSFLTTLLEDMREKDRHADALQKKLDALKSMEKNLMQREKP